MAVEVPDPKTLNSWDEAFQYPIPTVRNLERQLRRDVESNRGRLRSLVGYCSDLFPATIDASIDEYANSLFSVLIWEQLKLS